MTRCCSSVVSPPKIQDIAFWLLRPASHDITTTALSWPCLTQQKTRPYRLKEKPTWNRVLGLINQKNGLSCIPRKDLVSVAYSLNTDSEAINVFFINLLNNNDIESYMISMFVLGSEVPLSRTTYAKNWFSLILMLKPSLKSINRQSV